MLSGILIYFTQINLLRRLNLPDSKCNIDVKWSVILIIFLCYSYLIFHLSSSNVVDRLTLYIGSTTSKIKSTVAGWHLIFYRASWAMKWYLWRYRLASTLQNYGLRIVPIIRLIFFEVYIFYCKSMDASPWIWIDISSIIQKRKSVDRRIPKHKGNHLIAYSSE